MTASAPFIRPFDSSQSHPVLQIGGDWTLAHYEHLEEQVNQLREHLDDTVQMDLQPLAALDTAGAALLLELLGSQRLREIAQQAQNLSAERRALLLAVANATASESLPPLHTTPSALREVLGHVGVEMEEIWGQTKALLGFIGLTLSSLFITLPRPRRWRITALVANLEQCGLNAVPIVALLTFLVGAVVAFLGATILADFGASIYTVNLVAFSFLREFGVLLTAILMAGRTASAFTAQIGSMKANEEIDAIRTLGLNPIELLVLPRLLAMLIALPMLTFVAMLSGMLGGGLVCAFALDIPPVMYLSILQDSVELRHFLVGMLKAPLFAFLIALIGCQEGFKVSGSAQSVGEHTTSAVVQSIFIVILLDALAALFFMEMGW
ncbi:Phospholipid/cholesterol/gamma-HCH transport system permease protein [Pseudomonas sp. 8Z]|uniref:MlaE family ABC transporter permease n=1 Tax=Pseudomonas sp. 8Z TaxID=2653166 RepID=UPI0012F2BB2B|nr:ABC transporter permease [Pseudomonas sp. 8Z]VXC07143.1 Phospholipid/cholesterol/gamma-HCH transport system permease protein [Pseudomonas sp. 8Z]